MFLSQAPLTSVGIVEFLEDLDNAWTKSALKCYPIKMATAPAGVGRLCKCFSIRFMIWPVSKLLHNRTGTYMRRSK